MGETRLLYLSRSESREGSLWMDRCWVPDPVNTASIPLSEDLQMLQERLAKNVHSVWAQKRIREGWTYGPVKDFQRKKTPFLVPYAELPESEKEYDRATALETLRLILRLGYRIEKDGKPSDEAVSQLLLEENEKQKL